MSLATALNTRVRKYLNGEDGQPGLLGSLSTEKTAGLRFGDLIDSIIARLTVLDLSEALTGEAYASLADNLANAFEFRQGAASFLKFITTDGSESIAAAQRLTTTDGVASGTARIVGGLASVMVVEPAVVSGIAVETDFATTHTLPANTIKAGTKVKARICVRHPSTNGTDTFQYKVTLGSTVIHTTAAVDLANDDVTVIDVEITGRAAPAAAAEVHASGWSVNKTTAAASSVVGNQATNGALVLKVSALHGSNNAANDSYLAAFSVEYHG